MTEQVDIDPGIQPEPSIPVPEDASAPAASPAAPTQPPPSRQEALRSAFSNHGERGKHAAFQPRDAGRFAPGPPSFPIPERPAMPTSLRRELQPHWEKASPYISAELLTAINQRDSDYEKGLGMMAQYRTQAAEADDVLGLFKPYEWILKSENATPKAAISALLQTAVVLRTGTPAQKAQSVAQAMRDYNIPLEVVHSLLNGQQVSPQGSPPAENQAYNQLAQQVQELTQHFTRTQQHQQQQLENKALSIIQKFASEPANSHFEKVQDRMLMLLEAPDFLGDISAMSEREKLQLAYDTAIRLDPVISAQVLAHQQARSQAKNSVTSARSAAVQVNGSPGSGASASVNPTDRRAVIANALRQSRQ